MASKTCLKCGKDNDISSFSDYCSECRKKYFENIKIKKKKDVENR
jgi:NMD protein affecting ribosome stability and mRNA decay